MKKKLGKVEVEPDCVSIERLDPTPEVSKEELDELGDLFGNALEEYQKKIQAQIPEECPKCSRKMKNVFDADEKDDPEEGDFVCYEDENRIDIQCYWCRWSKTIRKPPIQL